MTEGVADRLAHTISTDWRKAELSPPDQALCAFAEKLTLDQHSMTRADVDTLRTFGFEDRAIHDAAQVIGYFNYITRIADALGVDLEDFVREWEKEQ
jgi:uncharacterized peroxidase-related enzyme